MKFNMVQCLDAFSFALDFVVMDYFKVALHHSRKVAYISLNIGRALNLPEEDIKDLYTLSLMHDNGLTAAGLKYDDFELMESLGDHCIEGEENIQSWLCKRLIVLESFQTGRRIITRN